MLFHRFAWKKDILVIIAEPRPKTFFWLCIFLTPDLRNGKLSKEIVKYILFELRGKHHIYWLRTIKTFNQLSIELGWVDHKYPKFFLNCRQATARSLKQKTAFHPLFSLLLEHQQRKKCPALISYESKYDVRLTLERIKSI